MPGTFVYYDDSALNAWMNAESNAESLASTDFAGKPLKSMFEGEQLGDPQVNRRWGLEWELLPANHSRAAPYNKRPVFVLRACARCGNVNGEALSRDKSWTSDGPMAMPPLMTTADGDRRRTADDLAQTGWAPSDPTALRLAAVRRKSLRRPTNGTLAWRHVAMDHIATRCGACREIAGARLVSSRLHGG